MSTFRALTLNRHAFALDLRMLTFDSGNCLAGNLLGEIRARRRWSR
jgi:hypothetical protein